MGEYEINQYFMESLDANENRGEITLNGCGIVENFDTAFKLLLNYNSKANKMKKIIMKYCSFKGKASVSEYRRMFLIVLICFIFVPFVASMFSKVLGPLVFLFMFILLVIPIFATVKRRLNDLNLTYFGNMGMRTSFRLFFEDAKNVSANENSEKQKIINSFDVNK